MLSFRIPSFMSPDIIFLHNGDKCTKQTYVPVENIIKTTEKYHKYVSPYGYIHEVVKDDNIDNSYAIWEIIYHFDIITSTTTLSYLGDVPSKLPQFISNYYMLNLQPNIILQDERSTFTHCCLEYDKNNTSFDDWYSDNDGLDSVIIIKISDITCGNTYNNILTNIIIAIIRQSIGGSLIIEIPEIASVFSIDLIYILGYFYEDVFTVNPEIAECYRREKFIFCYGLRQIEKKKNIYIMKSLLSHSYGPNSFIIANNIPHAIIKIVTQAVTTCENIKLVTVYDKIRLSDKKTHIQLDINKKRIISNCIKWCMKNGIEINE